jgi:hypothetical protein
MTDSEIDGGHVERRKRETAAVILYDDEHARVSNIAFYYLNLITYL